MTPGDFERLRSRKGHRKISKGHRNQANSPVQNEISRKKSSLQLSASPQPLFLSIESSPPMDEKAYSPELAVSPQSSSTGPTKNCEESDDESINITRAIRKGPKTERRTAHNLIEKKYRCSINDRINHLKEMLAPEEAKVRFKFLKPEFPVQLSKSATLRKAIDHINSLRQHNIDLIRENELLKKSIKALGAEVPLIVSNKFTKTSTSISIPDDSSESTGSIQVSLPDKHFKSWI